MHVTSLHKFHMFSQIVHGIEQHKLATLIGLIGVVGLLQPIEGLSSQKKQ